MKARPGASARKMLAAYVQSRLQIEAATAPHGYQARVARATGVASAHVSNIITESRKPGPDFIEAIAGFWGCSMAELRQEAANRAHGWSADPSLAAVRFPNRTRVLDVFGPDFSAEAVSRLRATVPRSGKDMPASWWFRYLELLEEEEHPV